MEADDQQYMYKIVFSMIGYWAG